ncbi:MAG: phycobilisome rod-core linker polypeptide [Cyanobacteria bacterium J06635_15]
MQTLANNNQFIPINANGAIHLKNGFPMGRNGLSDSDKHDCLTATYRRLFKDNRDLDFHHNAALDSAYLNHELTTRELVCELICSDMFINFILANNSNYRFVALCFERVLGRPATQTEIFKWSSLLASEGIRPFAEALTSCDEYLAAFDEHTVPFQRSAKLFSSEQNLPALPKELSIKRYQGEGNVNQYYPSAPVGPTNPLWKGNMPPKPIRQAGAVITVAGVLELGRIVLTIAWQALSGGHL